MAVPPLIVQGMVAGVASVSRSYLLSGKVTNLASDGEELIAWALSYPARETVRLADLDSQSVWRNTTLQSTSGATGYERSLFAGDHALIVKAAAELAAKKGYAALTAPRIRPAAGVSRRKFDAHFDGVEDCYLAALEQRAAEAMAQAARAQTAARSRAGGIYRAIAAICDHIATDPLLARVCFTGDFAPTPHGDHARRRLADAAIELFTDDPPVAIALRTEASTAAVWSLFLYHVLRDRALRHQISATLAYLALAPSIGPTATVRALEREQAP